MMRTFAFLLAALLFAAAGAAAADPPFDAAAARSVFEARCSRCHPLDRSTKKNKDRAGWQKTVERMKGYAGGAISDADAQAIVEHLSRTRGTAP